MYDNKGRSIKVSVAPLRIGKISLLLEVASETKEGLDIYFKTTYITAYLCFVVSSLQTEPERHRIEVFWKGKPRANPSGNDRS